MKLLYTFLLALLTQYSLGQIQPQNGVKPSSPEIYILRNATIYVSPTKKINNASIVVEKDKITKVGLTLIAPKGAVEIDLKGKTVVPAFIELNSEIGVPSPKKPEWNPRPQYNSNKKGAYYWNEAIHPEINANELYTIDEKANETLIKSGFGFALTHQKDGISRGSGVLVSLGADDVNANMHDWVSTGFFSFQKGASRQAYPSSQMGAIALLRQSIYDAIWYSKVSDKERNLSLEALNDQIANGKIFFDVSDELEIHRAAKIASEFDLKFMYLGSGREYLVLDELKSTNSGVVIPINFPDAYDVQNPFIARQIPLSDLKHWELAPHNPRFLAENNISFSISATSNKNEQEFWKNLRKALENGLEINAALNALTLEPAKMLGVDDKIGSIEEGKLASFMIYDEDPFLYKGKVIESWIRGNRNIIEFVDHEDVSGKFNLAFDGKRIPIEITGSGKSLKGKVNYDKVTYDKRGNKLVENKEVEAKVEVDHQDINIQFPLDDGNLNGSVILRGKINPRLKIFEGDGMMPNGDWVKWSGIRLNILPAEKDKNDKLQVKTDTNARIWYPNTAYGFSQFPDTLPIIIENATLWTNEKDGILKNGSIIIEGGKISFVGSGNFRKPANAIVIDGQGKHVTSGIIDEHSHIAISKGVNESGQAVSAEVSIGDVVDPTDINIYRQLSGGVTAAQLLHGSANPIGGQSALVKLKWGGTADDMLITNAPGFIKFALGENVKQSNWGNYNTVRFPQTRMGVEQLFFDAFVRAQKYAEAKEKFKKGLSTEYPRMDLELEVINQILNGERFVTCHSYVQSEINMLMHVADSMGFTLNTFTHILEGYKVADKMVEHGAGGSTFSDWWAYKYEVNDAIPYNAALMHNQGVVVAINSDDAEMGRRLNQEAAKGVKYGGMSQEDAWKMVTLNPAKLLHLDDRMGSLKSGKDADIVIWSDNPLSINAKVLYTIVDGIVLFDHERDVQMREINQKEKARIISKMLESNKKGEGKKPFFKKKKGHYHCDTIGEEATTEQNLH